MKSTLILLSLIFIFGCGKIEKTGGSLLTINGCEYAIYNSNNGVGMTHAGNCKNHIANVVSGWGSSGNYIGGGKNDTGYRIPQNIVTDSQVIYKRATRAGIIKEFSGRYYNYILDSNGNVWQYKN